MKCPKCNYLGFETGDRCKNCGYDFSLIAEPSGPADIDFDLDLALRVSDDTLPVSVEWDDKFDAADKLSAAFAASPSPVVIPDRLPPAPVLAPEPAPEPAARAPAPPVIHAVRTDRKLPLFAPAFDDDEPLIKLPATPRAPLAVRRTPEMPRLRTVPKPSRPIESAPALEFVEETVTPPIVESAADVRARSAGRLAADLAHAEVSGPGPRLAAAVVDHLLLSAIDVAVIYFTLRMTGLPMAQWTALPPVPLIAFLLLVKLSYFCAFTAVGGQTIGKMAARIRVVTTDDAEVDAALAVKRTLAGAVSAALLGLGYLPALIGSQRQALHDRVTHTRVIALPSV